MLTLHNFHGGDAKSVTAIAENHALHDDRYYRRYR